MIYEFNKIKAQRGDDLQFLLVPLEANGQPIQFTAATAIKLVLKNEDNTLLELAPIGAVNVGYGEAVTAYSFTLTGAETLALPLIQGAPVYWEFTYGTAKRRVAMTNVVFTTDFVF